MSSEFDTKLDTLISLFGRFIETNNGTSELSDAHVRAQWSNLRGLLNNRPVNLNSVYSFIGKVQEKPSQEPSSPGLRLRKLGSASGTSPLTAAKDVPDINKKRLLDDVKQLMITFKSNTTKIFKP